MMERCQLLTCENAGREFRARMPLGTSKVTLCPSCETDVQRALDEGYDVIVSGPHVPTLARDSIQRRLVWIDVTSDIIREGYREPLKPWPEDGPGLILP